ncbi:MAG TPA: DsbA family protein [Candidatus Wolfebacteria bacterium]|nr:DsbA family protein [Candidatus Wolfebacteria bacterium]
MENQNKSDKFLSISVLVAAVLIGGSLIYSAGLKKVNNDNQAANLKEPIINLSEPQIGDDVILGDPKAPVTIIVFSDYQCPFCARYYKETESLIRKNYIETGKAKLIHKDLAFLGPESTVAAQAAECAKDQGKYWQYHDQLFEIEIKEFEEKGNSEHTGNLNRETFQEIASNLEMNVEEFLNCFDSKKYAAEVENDVNEAKAAMGQNISTPTIFINGKMIQGAYPYDVFVKAIEEALVNVESRE